MVTISFDMKTFFILLFQSQALLINGQNAGQSSENSIFQSSTAPFPAGNSTELLSGTGTGVLSSQSEATLFSSSSSIPPGVETSSPPGGNTEQSSAGGTSFISTIPSSTDASQNTAPASSSASEASLSTSVSVPLPSTGLSSQGTGLPSTDLSSTITSLGSTILNSSQVPPPASSPIPSSAPPPTSGESETISSILGSDTGGGASESASQTASVESSVASTGPITTAPSSTDAVVLPSGITPPPGTTTLDTTGTEIQTSASDLSTIIIGVFPHIQEWIDNPEPPKATEVNDELDNILPKASDFLAKLPKPTDPLEPCSNSQSKRRREVDAPTIHRLYKRAFLDGLFKTVFNLVTCIIDDTNKLKDNIDKGTTDTVETLTNELKPMVDALNNVDPNDQQNPSASISDEKSSTEENNSSKSSPSSSSSSCTLQTASDCSVACTATAVTTVGGAKRQADGVTSTSTVTSTSSVSRLCSPEATECANNDAPPQPTGVDLKAYSTAPNGRLFLPPETTLPGDVNVQARAQETGTPSQNPRKRALPHPEDAVWQGDINGWIRGQVTLANRLAHGQGDVISTAFTFPLGNTPDSWAVVNLYGCTSVIVVSRKRMWMSHFWEVPSFQDPNNVRPHILDPLRNGGAGIQEGIAAFTGVGGDFENTVENKVRAFIVTPNRRGVANPASDDLNFPSEVGKIKDELKDILGREDTVTVSYIPRWANDGYPGQANVFAHPWGKVLVQYDPVQALVQVEGQCDRQIAQLEIWVEDNPLYRYRDYWDAFPNQLLAAAPAPAANPKAKRILGRDQITHLEERDLIEYWDLLKRQDGGSCPISSGTVSASSSGVLTSQSASKSDEPNSATVSEVDPTSIPASSSELLTLEPPSSSSDPTTSTLSPKPSDPTTLVTTILSKTSSAVPTSSSPAVEYTCEP
ncbi:hypothetical protein CC78DRAFT_595429 [Lojkania enalia]|uniref:Uncharacterized protein n=1 Tax=Lojkania enalia TaxID=147567 RepID=A0A9P4KCK5_9PLEO|nr:hypothetical protein CC78DRAFT_595429 [Didymosphaeria enalia]